MLHFRMNWTPATPVGLPRALFASSPNMEAAFSAPFWCNASPLDATLPSALACIANKGFREIVSPLDATLTKNRGVGPVMVNQTSYALMPRMAHGSRTNERVSRTANRSDTILSAFLRRSAMHMRLRTWMVPALAGLALFYVQAAVAQHP